MEGQYSFYPLSAHIVIDSHHFSSVLSYFMARATPYFSLFKLLYGKVLMAFVFQCLVCTRLQVLLAADPDTMGTRFHPNYAGFVP